VRNERELITELDDICMSAEMLCLRAQDIDSWAQFKSRSIRTEEGNNTTLNSRPKA
jgi:hypothetical protein